MISKSQRYRGYAVSLESMIAPRLSRMIYSYLRTANHGGAPGSVAEMKTPANNSSRGRKAVSLGTRATFEPSMLPLFVLDVLFFVSRPERSSGGIKFQRDVRGQRQDSFEGFVLGPILLSCPDVSRRVYLPPCNRR